MRGRAEEAIHKAITGYLRAVLPHGWIVQHTANRPRSKAAGAAEKAMGAVAGWPDLALYGRVGDRWEFPFAFFAEIKTAKGRLSPEQREVHERLHDIGFPVAVVRSIDDMRAALRSWGVGTKEIGR